MYIYIYIYISICTACETRNKGQDRRVTCAETAKKGGLYRRAGAGAGQSDLGEEGGEPTSLP